jgi:hypothetical protein
LNVDMSRAQSGLGANRPARLSERSVPWIVRAPHAPYFLTEHGDDWHPVGHNDAVTWPGLAPLFRARDVQAVELYLQSLAQRGTTVLRLMLEYAQHNHRYIERPVGRFSPSMVRMWDDLFELCRKHGLRILLTPYDTFWMWLKFARHPYNRAHGGPLDHPSQLLTCPETRRAIKARLTFAIGRWGGSGTLFAWDLWNEIHPAHGGDSAEPFESFIQDLSDHVRAEEERLFGRSHLQTVSLFGPELIWRAHLRMEEPIFRHPALDFASIHIYQQGTIDAPKNTVDPAIAMGEIVARSLQEIGDGRPFLDSEHGPIHSFKDRHITLPEDFDDEYFRHISWAHLASGGAGGGMRWPNRHPHLLTRGMSEAQAALARFLPNIDWAAFDRRNRSEAIEVSGSTGPVASKALARFATATSTQAVVYLLRRDGLDKSGKLRRDRTVEPLRLVVPGLEAGRFEVVSWCTLTGQCVARDEQTNGAAGFRLPPFAADLAVAIRAVES